MAIQQHPLPQDISAYRFRLIGDMTIKQFVSLGVGIVGAIIFYSSPLPFFFKYPLSFVTLLLGVGAAFVPIQGRTLDTWIVAFIRSIYSPTQYVWKQTSPENITADVAAPSGTANLQTAPQVSNARIEISKGITSTPAPSTPSITITPPSAEAAPPEVPKSVIPQKSILDNTLSALSQPKELPKEEIVVPPTVPNNQNTDQTPFTQNTTPETNQTTPSEKTASAPVAATPETQSPQPQTTQLSQLPIPFTPSTPNTLVGLTITPDNKILDGVLVEIKKDGLTSRATKSNKLGQFMFARPLENGIYQIFADKDGFNFTPYSLELTGTVIRPLKIQAQ